MENERIGDMTLEELKALIKETAEKVYELREPKDYRSVAEIIETIRRHRPTPPPGSPSNQELLREDRDR
jgi:hypothetical protein